MKQIVIFFIMLVMSISVYGQYSFKTKAERANGDYLEVEVIAKDIILSPNGGNCVVNIEYEYSYQFYNQQGNPIDIPLYTLHGNFSWDNNGSIGNAHSFFPILNSNNGVSANFVVQSAYCQGVTLESVAQGMKACIVINFKGYNQNTHCVAAEPISPLPIELLSFKAIKSDHNVEVSWETATERNNDFFTVLRSKDGETWENVQIIPGAGNSTRPLHYTWTDNTPLSDVSYYRLKQTDFDGQTELFNIVSVKRLNSDALTVYPNPVTQIATLSGMDERHSVRVFNTVGVEVTKHLPSLINNTIDLSNLPQGVYYIKNGERRISVLKQ